MAARKQTEFRKTGDALDKESVKTALLYANEILTLEIPNVPGLDANRLKACLYAACVFNRMGATETASLTSALRCLDQPPEINILDALKLSLAKDIK